MQPFSLEKLPEEVKKIQDKLDIIEALLLGKAFEHSESEGQMTVTEAAAFLNLKVPTIYSKVSKGELPVNKPGKKLYFNKADLTEWIKSGKKATSKEITKMADNFVTRRAKRF